MIVFQRDVPVARMAALDRIRGAEVVYEMRNVTDSEIVDDLVTGASGGAVGDSTALM
ncbi:hypothetical protein ABTY53_05405 [Streptomyces noursei]|uniref:hypothetical protein n=1 Tax=Streptomyces noursei TaxID=1971 RepID=UPI00331BEF25